MERFTGDLLAGENLPEPPAIKNPRLYEHFREFDAMPKARARCGARGDRRDPCSSTGNGRAGPPPALMMDALNLALREIGIAEANLAKLDRLWSEIEQRIPEGLIFGAHDPEYDASCLSFRRVLEELPPIDQFSVDDCLLSLDAIASARFDAMEADDFECKVSVEQSIAAQGRQLAEYRIRLADKRREIARRVLPALVEKFEALLELAEPLLTSDASAPARDSLRNHIAQMDTVFGETIERPKRWRDLQRHLHFCEPHDVRDMRTSDWPAIKRDLPRVLHEADVPLMSAGRDLSAVVEDVEAPVHPLDRASAAPLITEFVVTQLRWQALDPEQFERLTFSLICNAPGYEDPTWLTHTKAPDRGRDIAGFRTLPDALGSPVRQRVIIQCRHWLSQSVAVDDIATLIAQMKLWEPPRVDLLIIATSGRFSIDAVSYIDRHNAADHALSIVPWAASHLEMLLARRPQLVAELQLR